MTIAPVQRRLMEFIREHLPGEGYSVSKLTGDASDRQYFRYSEGPARNLILAAYPEAFDPDTFPYSQIAGLLTEIGVPTPEVLEVDGVRGIVLQQDLGDWSLQKKLVEANPAIKVQMLRRAIDLIHLIQLEGTKRLRPEMAAHQLAFDEEKLVWELGFFRHHYLEGYRRLSFDQEAVAQEFTAIALQLSQRPRVLCHRDFHVRNLMVCEQELYVIDFQDARLGPRTYDLVSLLQDSLALSWEDIECLVGYYRAGISEPLSDFWSEFHLMSVQRLLKALGTFAYQARVRENFIYEQYMPGSFARALRSVRALGEFPVLTRLLESESER